MKERDGTDPIEREFAAKIAEISECQREIRRLNHKTDVYMIIAGVCLGITAVLIVIKMFWL